MSSSLEIEVELENARFQYTEAEKELEAAIDAWEVYRKRTHFLGWTNFALVLGTIIAIIEGVPRLTMLVMIAITVWLFFYILIQRSMTLDDLYTRVEEAKQQTYTPYNRMRDLQLDLDRARRKESKNG